MEKYLIVQDFIINMEESEQQHQIKEEYINPQHDIETIVNEIMKYEDTNLWEN